MVKVSSRGDNQFTLNQDNWSVSSAESQGDGLMQVNPPGDGDYLPDKDNKDDKDNEDE